MIATELREKSVDELRRLLIEQAQKQFKMRMEAGMGEAPKSRDLTLVRRDIARINTIINEKERQA